MNVSQHVLHIYFVHFQLVDYEGDNFSGYDFIAPVPSGTFSDYEGK